MKSLKNLGLIVLLSFGASQVLAEGEVLETKPGIITRGYAALTKLYNNTVTPDRISFCKEKLSSFVNFVMAYPKSACGVVVGVIGGSFLACWLMKKAKLKKEQAEKLKKEQQTLLKEESDRKWESDFDNNKKDAEGTWYSSNRD
jgi:hypothetical protein